jgi:hypothetical protein
MLHFGPDGPQTSNQYTHDKGGYHNLSQKVALFALELLDSGITERSDLIAKRMKLHGFITTRGTPEAT